MGVIGREVLLDGACGNDSFLILAGGGLLLRRGDDGELPYPAGAGAGGIRHRGADADDLAAGEGPDTLPLAS